ncbi:ROK family protein [bacterium]|nr:ROK family protein [bacterium]
MFIGVDVGGTTIKTLLLAENEIIAFETEPNVTTSEKSVLESIEKAISKIISKKDMGKVEAIGLSIAGQVDSQNGILINAPNMPLKSFNFNKYFKEKYGKECFVDNDVNCAAIAESSLYPVNTTQIFIFLGTGIGGAAMINGKMLRGANNLAMEIGHMTHIDGGHQCGCGKRGCYEAYAGGKSLNRLYQEATGTTEYMNIIKIEDGALNGDKHASKIFNEAIHALSALTNDLITIFNPDYIIFGGGVIEHSKTILDSIKGYLKSNIRFANLSDIKFKESVFKDRSNAYGAILGYIRKHI